MTRTRIAAIACALALAGCADLLGSDPDEGTLSFRHAGASFGTFAARGVLPEEPWSREYAAGLARFGALRIEAARPSGRRFDAIILHANSTQPGTYPLGIPGSGRDATGQILFGYDFASSHASEAYEFTSGALVLEEVSDARIRGRFSGTAVTFGGGDTLTVIAGRFDVPDNLPPPVFD